MLFKKSKICVVDNSGASYGRVIGLKKKLNFLTLGSLAILSLVRLRKFRLRSKEKAKTTKKLKKGTIFPSLIVSLRRPFLKNQGIVLKFFGNSCILLKKKSKNPLGTRILGFVSMDLRFRGFFRLVVISPRIV